MKCNWIDLPEKKHCFTTRNAELLNLNTGEIIQHYSANTKIVVVQKCITEKGTFYRTESAAYNRMNNAFEAAALGLPNEVAPPSSKDTLHLDFSPKSEQSSKKQTAVTHKKSPSGGEAASKKKPWYKRMFTR